MAILRGKSGKSVAAKERDAGRVPSILFEQENGEEGGNKRLISVKRNQIWKLVKQLGSPFFLSRLFDLEVRSAFEDGDGAEVIEKARVLPRLVCYICSNFRRSLSFLWVNLGLSLPKRVIVYALHPIIPASLFKFSFHK